MNTTIILIPGKDRFMAVKAHFLATGLTTRIHKRTRCLPHNALSFVEVKNLVRLLKNYAETHAILLPGRIPGYKRDNIQLLLTCTTKKVSFRHVIHTYHTHKQSQLKCTTSTGSITMLKCHYTYICTLNSTLLCLLTH